MEELQLLDIQQIELQILKHLDEFCDKNQLKYYLSNGTLLGAVKYKEFIPWDDDIDILMPREDYNKLLRMYPDESQFWLVDSDKYSEYPFPFAKLCDRTTEIKESLCLEGQRLGIHIDIFPLDYLPKEKNKRTYLLKKRKFLITMLGFSMSSFIPGKTFLRTVTKYILTAIAKMLGKQIFVRLLDLDYIDKRNDLSYEYRGCIAWPVYGEKEIMHSSIFEKSVFVEFEGKKFPAPKGYDSYLKKLYGKYQLEPPVDKQRTHHRFTAYKKKFKNKSR